MPDSCWANCRLKLRVAGPTEAHQVAVDRPYVLLGSDSSRVDVAIEDNQIDPCCFVICLTSRGLVGVSLAYRPSPRRFRPIDGRRGIRIGDHRITIEVETAGLPDEVEQHDGMAVRWRTEGQNQFVRVQPGKPILFGRNLPSTLRIPDSRISTVHGFVYRQDSRLWVVDVASRNGIYVGKQRVEHAAIDSGDTFSVGQTRLRYLPTADSQAATTHSEVVSKAEFEDLQENHRRTLAELETLRTEHAEQDGTRKRIEFEANQVAILVEKVDRREAELAEQVTAFAEDRERFDGEVLDRRAALEAQRAEFEKSVDEWHGQCARQQQLLAQAQTEHQATCAESSAEQERQQRELEVKQRRLELQEQDLNQQRCDLEQVAQEVDAMQHRLNVLVQDVHTQRTALSNDIENFVDRFKAILRQIDDRTHELNQQQANVQSEGEKVLVRRIRLQRERSRLEAALRERERSLAQKEQQLLQVANALQQRRAAVKQTSRWREPIRTTPSPNSQPTVDIELANPLLESADFTNLLDRALRDSKDADRDT